MLRDKVYRYFILTGLCGDTAIKASDVFMASSKGVQESIIWYFEGFNLEQIAGKMRCDISTVSRRIDRFKREVQARR